MPALIDYAVRYAQVREAVFAIVLREGAHAVSVPAISAEIGISSRTLQRLVSTEQLPYLGLQRVERLDRRVVVGGVPRGLTAEERAVWHVLRLLPLDDLRREQALVRDAIVAAFARRDARVRAWHEVWSEGLDLALLAMLEAYGHANDPLLALIGLRAMVDGMIRALCHGDLAARDAELLLRTFALGERWNPPAPRVVPAS